MDPLTRRQERWTFIIIVVIALSTMPINELSRYYSVQSIKDNTDENFLSRAAEHLEQEKRQFTMIENQRVLAQDNQILYEKIDNLEKKIDLLNGTTK